MDWLGKNPRPPPVHLQGCRAGPEFSGQDENYIAPLRSKVRLAAALSSPAPWSTLPREAEKCDPPVSTHWWNNWDNHCHLPLQRHSPRCPYNVAEVCQARQPYNIQSLRELGPDLINPRGAANAGLFNSPGDLSPVMGEPSPKSFGSASSSECMLVGLRRSNHPTIDSVELPDSLPEFL